RRHTRFSRDWSSDVCSSDLAAGLTALYFGAFLSGLRPALWYGSRFYPLLGSLLFYLVLQSLLTDRLPWKPMAMAIALAIEFCMRSEERRVGDVCRWWLCRCR